MFIRVLRPSAVVSAVLALVCAASGQPGLEDGAIVVDRERGSIPRVLGPAPTVALLESLSEEARLYMMHVTTLANPFFEGRAPGTRGNELAAEYIEHQFRRLNLLPAFSTSVESAEGAEVLDPNTSFRQAVSAGSHIAVRNPYLALAPSPMADGLITFRAGSDFTVMPQSASGEGAGKVVFVGYSIEGGPDGYSSYPGGVELTGKIAVMLRFEPMDAEGKSRWAPGRWSEFANLDDKIRAAAGRGAAGIIMINPPGADDLRAGQMLNVDGARGGMRGVPVPTYMMSAEAGNRLVSMIDAEGRSLMDLRRLADSAGQVIEFPEATLSLSATIERQAVRTDNVGAVLRGKGTLADEYIVIGAHYDHIGDGSFGSMSPARRGEIHPGADDNASGTSGLLLTARTLAKAYAELPSGADARSIIFLAFTAEEMGLIGSAHYVRNPSVPLGSISFMLNMDMIGRLSGDRFEIGGANTGVDLERWVQSYVDAFGSPVRLPSRLASNSDHASFHRARIPVLFFFTGLHSDYHAVGDEWWKVDVAGAVRIVDMCAAMTLDMARRGERFEFQAQQRAAREPPAAPQVEEPADDQPRMRTLRVRFGIMPGDYSDTAKGVLIGDVTPNTSASEAGLKAGDRITKWNGQDVDSIETWMPMLANHNPGDLVEVTFIRDGKEMRAYAILKAADPGGR